MSAKMRHGAAGLMLLSLILWAGTAPAAPGVETDPCKARVPADQLTKAKATKNPIAPSPQVIAEGKAIYEGKGVCFTCHGLSGKGDGDAGKALDPGPRNFTNSAFHNCKSDGEMFWAVNNGIAGTGMVPAVATGILTEEEAWKVILYVRTFKGK